LTPRNPPPSEEDAVEPSALAGELVIALAAVEGMRQSTRDEAIGGTLHALRARLLRMLRRECDRLDLLRIALGRLPLRLEPVDVRRLCEEVAAAARPLCDRSHIGVDVEPGTVGRGPLRLDRERTEQALILLLGEALSLTQAGERVSLRLEQAGEATRVWLQTSGAASGGVAPALAAALVGIMGGRVVGAFAVELRDAPGIVTAEPTRPQGATAEWIAALSRTPELRMLPVDAATDRQAVVGRGLLEAPRALLLSDDPGLARLVAALLFDEAFLMSERADRFDAVAALSPALVLCDRAGTAARLRASGATGIPILLLAGPGEEASAHADAVLRRPFGAPELRAAARKLLRREVVEDAVEEDRLAALTLVAAGVAHEVLNPLWFLTLALFDLEKLLSGADVPAVAREEGARLVESARIGMDRVSSVMSDLRAYALREAAAQPAPADLHEGIRRTLRLLLLRRPEGVRVHTDLCEDGRVVCRAGRMNQVFFNLVLNALQAVGDQGDVWIRSWAEGDRLHVSVRDTGPGIPPEQLGNLFRPFFTTKDPGRQSGLGLASSRRIVKEQGGEIQVKTEPGRGSEFIAVLPRMPPRGRGA
jgi:signal transduction histidine kinase